MKTSRPNTGAVLQGYFRSERFRGTSHAGVPAQSRSGSPPVSRVPRPKLLPSMMRGGAAQPKPRAVGGDAPRPELLPPTMRSKTGPAKTGQRKTRHQPDSPWSGAPRPELLPGMGPMRRSGPRRAAQARRSDGISSTPIPAGQLRTVGEGRPLDAGIRQTMESFFDADFSGVRVHEGPTAQSMGALAFTLGEELHFAPGLYDPTTRHGVELLGHELTHVVQQRDGRVANPYGQGVAIVQDPALEAEADRMGQQVAAELWSGSRGEPPSGALGGLR